MTPKEANTLLRNLREACDNDPDPLLEFTSIIWGQLEFILSGRNTIEEAEKYLREKIAENQQKVKP
jgi:hypothetical protein